MPGVRTHWAGFAERGVYWGLRSLAVVYRVAGQRGCMAALWPIVVYFHLTGVEQRRASREYLARVFAARGVPDRPGRLASLRHSLDFGRKALETFASWVGGIDRCRLVIVDREERARAFADKRGAVLIVSHLGNVELSRALLDGETRDRITVLVHTRHAENYNRILRRFRPEAAANMLQVTEIGPETAIALRERVERGEWVAIAGDRTPIGGGRASRVPFLGRAAAFPQGPYVLAHLLGCPVYLMFCLREAREYRVYLEKFAERIELPRGGKQAALDEVAARYARRLEAYCLKAPFQWYNFFDFWA